MFFIPIILLIISFATLASRIGFTFFPSGDNPFITLSIESSAGTTRDVFTPYYDRADAVLADIPEIKLAYYDVTRDTWTINVELYKLEDRDEYGGRSAFVVEEELLERL
jgi:multidrug efflux pump subunit AcrB